MSNKAKQKARRAQRRLMHKVDKLLNIGQPVHVELKRTRNITTCAKSKASTMPRPAPQQDLTKQRYRSSLGHAK